MASKSPKWTQVYRKAVTTIDALSNGGVDRLFFRGQANVDWSLSPCLARHRVRDVLVTESRLYFDWIVRSGILLQQDTSGWSALFEMQHHGIPTRLLDWSETFAVALYFALKNANGCDAAVWVLEPGTLNGITRGEDSIFDPSELGGTYYEYFISKSKVLKSDVVALSPLRHNPRVAQQRAGFTLHENFEQSLDELFPAQVTKIIIPASVHTAAAEFLRLAGVSEFTLFPDLDGLARELVNQHILGDGSFSVCRR